MGIEFSKEQNDVIHLRGRNILVSAAAGSGKTTVLVERIIRMISDEEHPVDIDHLLIVTFTKAAAASMREKISDAIAKRLQEHYSEHLQRQATLLHHAQITTIDSFCLFILQNNFNDIGLDPGFRVADEGEIRLLKEDVMEKMVEERLGADEGGSFAHLLDRFVPGKRMSAIHEILFDFYNKALSYPFVEDWLLERREDYAVHSKEEMCKSRWMEVLFSYIMQYISLAQGMARDNKTACEEAGGPGTYLPMMEADVALTDALAQADSFVALHERMQTLDFMTLSRKKDPDADPEVKERIKNNRDCMKDLLKDLKTDFFSYSIEDILTGFAENDRIVKELCDTTLDFHRRFMDAKKEKKIIDFSDMEHFALSILLEKKDGEYVPTKTALEYRNYFHEIMIDEYQDSNYVQEWLLGTISGQADGNYNRFMVGDVKQSIYQFRMARPQIFMEKYDTYEKEVGEHTLLQRIDLAKNYRSRKEVVEGVNSLFYRIMGRDLGNVSYDEESALYLGATYPEKPEGMDAVLLCLIEKDEKENDKKIQEAKLVAHKIRQLVGNYEVTDADGTLRKAGYGDIVILLRNLKGWDEAFSRVFEEEGIPLYVAKSTGYFSTGEIRVLLNFLKTLDNPKQDIPLFGTLHSALGGFTDEEIALLRSEKKETLYDSLLYMSKKEDGACEDGIEKNLIGKCRHFLEWFSSYRNRVSYEPIHRILRRLLDETGYWYEAASLPGGNQRLANIKMLLTKAETFEKSSYSGLFHFIRYIEKIQKYEVESGEAATQEEAADVVRVMTIHKSKGLEFPVCILAGCAGQFNMRDTESSLICESDHGIGLDYVDLNRRVKHKDIRKRFLARYMQEDSLGEELRVLYVAMTRAKEKLIMTGFCKDFEKLPIQGENKSKDLLPFLERRRAKSYLDWILKADSPLVQLSLYTAQDLETESLQKDIKSQWTKEMLLKAMDSADSMESKDSMKGERQDTEGLSELLTFRYPHEYLQNLYAKTSVSELKMAAIHGAYEKQSLEETPFMLFPTEEIVPYIPSFAKESTEVSGAARGSAYHRVLELLDYAKWYKDAGNDRKECLLFLQNSMEEFVKSGRMTQEEADMVDPCKITGFLLSPIAARMAKAQSKGALYKERPFVLGIEASRLEEAFPKEEKVLIQGIIDVYFIEEDGIVLLDYKTDVVKTPEELKNRYETQILYYTEALEKITGLTVKEKILYSFSLGQECRY